MQQMALHLPVHVYIQACLRYMHMARDCAAPPAHSQYNLMGGGRNPPSRDLMEPMLTYLNLLYTINTLYLYPGVHNFD